MIRKTFTSITIIGLAIVISASLVVFAWQKTLPVHAQVGGLPYGGQRLFTLTCTCSANLLEYILDYATMNVVMLVYQPPISILFEEFNPYGVYLGPGDYNPGAGACLIYAGTACTQITSTGMMGNAPGSGTSP